jgi:hypothetical protein
LQSPGAIGYRNGLRWRSHRAQGRGCSSGVEHDLAKVGVEGSNPFARSNFLFQINSIGAARFGAALSASQPVTARRNFSSSRCNEGPVASVITLLAGWDRHGMSVLEKYRDEQKDVLFKRKFGKIVIVF